MPKGTLSLRRDTKRQKLKRSGIAEADETVDGEIVELAVGFADLKANVRVENNEVVEDGDKNVD